MSSNKLTDTEIKKALECCKYSIYEKRCVDCFLIDEKRCIELVTKSALDLINRQDQENESLKAEVERLQNAYKQCAWERDIFAEDMTQEIKKDCSYLMLDIKTIKTEAYKEFAELVHCHCESIINQEWNKNVSPVSWADAYKEFDNEVDNLLNELVGDGE